MNEEIRRRERVIRIFPNRESAKRLIGALLMEIDKKWASGRKYLDMDGKKILGKLLTTVSSLITAYGNNPRAEPSLIGIKFRSTFIYYGRKKYYKDAHTFIEKSGQE